MPLNCVLFRLNHQYSRTPSTWKWRASCDDMSIIHIRLMIHNFYVYRSVHGSLISRRKGSGQHTPGPPDVYDLSWLSERLTMGRHSICGQLRITLMRGRHCCRRTTFLSSWKADWLSLRNNPRNSLLPTRLSLRKQVSMRTYIFTHDIKFCLMSDGQRGYIKE
jgi:hypothetical protein